MNVNPESHMPGWQGLTIKEILEKVDLFNISTLVEEEKKNIACAETDDVKVTILTTHKSWRTKRPYSRVFPIRAKS